ESAIRHLSRRLSRRQWLGRTRSVPLRHRLLAVTLKAGRLSRKEVHSYSLGYLGEPEKDNRRLFRPECRVPCAASPWDSGVDQAYPCLGSYERSATWSVPNVKA